MTIKDMINDIAGLATTEKSEILESCEEKQIEELFSLLNKFAEELTVKEFYSISSAFKDCEMGNYFDLDTEFIHLLEGKEGYPLSLLFTDTSSSDLVRVLRMRCWNALSSDAFAPSSDIPTFSKVYLQYLNSSETDFARSITSQNIKDSSLHELRLFLEVLIHHQELWDIQYIVQELISRLDEAPVSTHTNWK